MNVYIQTKLAGDEVVEMRLYKIEGFIITDKKKNKLKTSQEDHLLFHYRVSSLPHFKLVE